MREAGAVSGYTMQIPCFIKHHPASWSLSVLALPKVVQDGFFPVTLRVAGKLNTVPQPALK